jgi:NADH:ubiquinone oxidoreductase subunit 5 (subunit L)/multisubunit Na+/H+ antiporter MnhA subunit
MMIPDVLKGETQDLQLQWIPFLGIKGGVLVDPLSVLMSKVVARVPHRCVQHPLHAE